LCGWGGLWRVYELVAWVGCVANGDEWRVFLSFFLSFFLSVFLSFFLSFFLLFRGKGWYEPRGRAKASDAIGLGVVGAGVGLGRSG